MYEVKTETVRAVFPTIEAAILFIEIAERQRAWNASKDKQFNHKKQE